MIEIPSTFKLIFRAIAGSHLYGTNTKDSDIDERGVFIPDERYFYGFLNRIEQFEDKNNDITYFELRKFLHLASENNPNIIELLYIPKDKWLQYTDDWNEIYKNRNLFLSTKAKYTFSGYAHSQFSRIKLHRNWLFNPPTKKPLREDFGLSSNKSDLTKDQIGAFNVLLSLKLENIKEFHPLKEQLDIMEETRNFKNLCQENKIIDSNAIKEIISVSDQFIEILQKENAYAQAERHYNQYLNWKKNRNPERAKLEEKFGYDTKFTMHCFRLISEGIELLESGQITFPRPDYKFLLDIRNGLYKYEELEKDLNNIDNNYNKSYIESTLPKSPDRNEIDKLCIRLTKKWLKTNQN